MVDLNVNVTVKVPGLKKLADAASSGLGAVVGSWLAPWMAKQQGKAGRIEAISQAVTMQIIAQAKAEARQALAAHEAVAGTLEMTREQITQRLEYQELKRQRNLKSVVGQAAEELGDEEVADHETDHDWMARFFEYVQDVSEEDIRNLWGRILAGEVRSPGNVSLRTLSILRNMSHREAVLFAEAMRYRIDDYIFWKFCVKSSDTLTAGDFYYRFVDMGLFYSTLESRPPRRLSVGKKGAATVVNADTILFLQGQPNRSIDDDGNKSVLKAPAMELAHYCEVRSDSTYHRHLARYLAKKNCRLLVAPIEATTPDGHRYDRSKVRPVETV